MRQPVACLLLAIHFTASGCTMPSPQADETSLPAATDGVLPVTTPPTMHSLDGTPTSTAGVIPPTLSATHTPQPVLTLAELGSATASSIRLIAELSIPDVSGTIARVAFSPDSSLLLVGTTSGELLLATLSWEPNGQLVEDFSFDILRNIGGQIEDVAFARELGLVAVASSSGLEVVEISTGTAVAKFRPENDPYSVVFVEEDSKLVSGDWRGTIEIWDLEVSAAPREISTEPWKLGVCDLEVSPDGQILAAGYCDYNMMTWNIEQDFRTHKRVLGTDHWECFSHCPFPTNLIAFSPDGNALASGTDRNYGIPYRSIASGRLLGIFHTVRALTWTDPATDQEVEVFVAPRPVYGIAFSSDGSALLVAAGNELQALDIESGDLLFFAESSEQGDFVGLAVSPNGYLIATANEKNEIQLWGVESGPES